jgi:hypothetical protein
MELGPLLTLGILWAVLSVVGRLAGGKKGRPQRPRPTGPPLPGEQAGSEGEARQPESFAELLEMMRQQAEGRQIEAPEEEPVPVAVADVEDAASLDDDDLVWGRHDEASEPTVEPVPVVVSMGVDPDFEERVFHDHRKESQAAIDRRLKAAADRNLGRLPSDHARFDAIIRTPAPRKKVSSAPDRPSLKKLVVWREILGPPVGLRNPETDSEY